MLLLVILLHGVAFCTGSVVTGHNTPTGMWGYGDFRPFLLSSEIIFFGIPFFLICSLLYIFTMLKTKWVYKKIDPEAAVDSKTSDHKLETIEEEPGIYVVPLPNP
uniref:Uncharacterized protein n=1 Tax=Photinus pyralis TaxID=7054 RepID=A0A1Y1KQS0_PHOPY